MALPELIKHGAEARLTDFCERRIPAQFRDQVRLIFKFRGHSVTLIETRPHFQDPSVWTECAVAQFRFDAGERVWRPYCADRNTRWHAYDLIEASANLDDLIAEVDRDPTGIFFG